MKNNLYRKGLVFAVIVLFLGLCITPSTIVIEETAPILNDDAPMDEYYYALNVTIIL